MTKAIDCLVNVGFADELHPDWMVRVKEDYFKGDDSFFSSPELPELLETMDAQGVERAILLTRVGADGDRAQRYVAARPDRFSLGVGGFNLLKPMKTVRSLEAFVKDNPVSFAVVGPSFWGDGRYPPTDAVYFPLYTKCCELDLPLCINTGIPGPPLPADVQNPIHLDRVCIRFPELRLCMIHGADPWWDTAIRLMLKYRNLRLMTSAWSPKRLPESLLHFMRTRGTDRILFASDHPVLSMERCLTEANALDLPDEVRAAWLHDNAEAFFLGDRAQD
jgi:predicted TIM-barrel fold metal-dependent hydrolase